MDSVRDPGHAMQPAQPPPLEDLLGSVIPSWRGGEILCWCAAHHPARGLLNDLGGGVEDLSSRVAADRGDASIDELRSIVDDDRLFDGALSIGILEVVPPDDVVEVLRWLHDRLAPGGVLAVRVVTDILGERADSQPLRFCAATHMTAFRRAGFEFRKIERSLVDERAPVVAHARERMPFHDPLELRTALIDALLVRPDRTDLADLAMRTT